MAWSRIGIARTLVTAALIAVPHLALGDMLDEPACTQLKSEQQRMAADGLKTDMLHGPDWAKANLPTSRMEQIKHLIDVEEQIAFRCPLPPPPKAAEPAAAAPDEDGGTPKVTKRKKSKKKAEGESATFELPSLDALTGADQPAAKPQQKKAKKQQPTRDANDAFVPPASQGNAFVDGEAVPVPKAPPVGGPPSKQLTP